MNAQSKAVEPPWIPFEDRRRARDQKHDAVLRMALKLFLEQGYHRTTLSEIAARLNITKPALYNYFRSKEEILVECFRQGQDLYEASFAAVENGAGDGLQKLRRLIRAYVSVIASDFGVCVTRLDDRELSREARAVVRGAKRRIDTAFRQQIAAGICRRLDQAPRSEADDVFDRRRTQRNRGVVPCRWCLVGRRDRGRIRRASHRRSGRGATGRR